MASFLTRLWKANGGICPILETPFTDIDQTTAKADITCIYALGITKGTTPTTYTPHQPVTRQQMASFLARLWQIL